MTNKQLEKMINDEIKRIEDSYKYKINKKEINPSELASYIDHTILNAEASVEDIKILCDEAKNHNFFSVCINPSFVSLAYQILKETNVKVATVIGFPLGTTDTGTKCFETSIAKNEGAEEFDMVINIGMLKSKEYQYIYEDIKSVVETADNLCTKVIIETCYLTKEEIIASSFISKLAGASFVKTSTGFGISGAKSEDVNLMKYVVGDKVKVKASGGIRDYETAKLMIQSGAERIGASSGIKIIGS